MQPSSFKVRRAAQQTCRVRKAARIVSWTTKPFYAMPLLARACSPGEVLAKSYPHFIISKSTNVRAALAIEHTVRP
jgi:hypothetical protein